MLAPPTPWAGQFVPPNYKGSYKGTDPSPPRPKRPQIMTLDPSAPAQMSTLPNRVVLLGHRAAAKLAFVATGGGWFPGTGSIHHQRTRPGLWTTINYKPSYLGRRVEGPPRHLEALHSANLRNLAGERQRGGGLHRQKPMRIKQGAARMRLCGSLA